MKLVTLLETLNASAPLAQRHLWLIELLHWVRGNGSSTQATVERVQLFLQALQNSPEHLEQWRLWWRCFAQTVDIAPLLADYGFAPRTAFLSELGHRLHSKWLPSTPETTDAGELFALLLPSRFDAVWIKALDEPTILSLYRLVQGTPSSDEHVPIPMQWSTLNHFWQTALIDAVTFCISQVASAGFASEIHGRMCTQERAARPFHRLSMTLEKLRLAVHNHGPHSAQALDAGTLLRAHLDAAGQAAHSVYAHLQMHGISVGIVFRLQQLHQRIGRIKALLQCLQSPKGAHASAHFFAELAQIGQNNRSIRSLIANSSQLTAAKVAERNAQSGEQYITRDAHQYRQMLNKAAGGGAVIGLTTWAKFWLSTLGLSVFWAGFAAGLGYAFSFVLIQLLHLTLATKQPAVTAAAMAAKLKEIDRPDGLHGFVDEVANLFRSQIASIVGNVGSVVPVVILLSIALQWGTSAPMISALEAQHTLNNLDVLGLTPLFAALTGTLLFASSVIAGWVENWFVLNKLDSALRYNRRFRGLLGQARAERCAIFLRHHISGLSANISLGLLLGLMPAFADFFGLGLNVRHVTLSAGQTAAAVASLGLDVLSEPVFWSAVAGVALIGPLNLGVSFYLAFGLALRAQGIDKVNRRLIYTTIAHRIRTAPLSFIWPMRAKPHSPPDK